MPLSRIADECGFSSQSHLATSFRAVHAAAPTEFRAQTKQAPDA
jgi:AraC family transcriptional regulator